MESPMHVRIGEDYAVPSAITSTGMILPVLFPPHADGAEICINPVPRHYHIDRRFVFTESDIFSEDALTDLKYRSMTCIDRQTILNEYHVFMIERLHRLYENHELTNNRCPHKGTQIVNGCGTCPNHGLIWDLNTNKLKHKLPFYLQCGKNRGMIHDGQCVIPIVEKVPDGKFVFNLIDAHNNQYPKAKFVWNGEPSVGDNLSINDSNCGIK